jgi:hypothetical protein
VINNVCSMKLLSKRYGLSNVELTVAGIVRLSAGSPVWRRPETDMRQRQALQYSGYDNDYFVMSRWAVEVAAGASGEIANVSHVFQPCGRLLNRTRHKF